MENFSAIDAVMIIMVFEVLGLISGKNAYEKNMEDKLFLD